MSDSITKVRPKVFVASSTEGLAVARQIIDVLFEEADCLLWNDARIAGVGGHILERLERALDKCPYAVIILTPDDRVESRGESHSSPRDNLLFELGMFAGRHGRQSALMVVPAEPPVKIPSDLDGIIACKYKIVEGADEPRHYDVTAACMRITRALNEHRSSRERPAAEGFWRGLSKTVLIVHGVDPSPTPNPKDHQLVSKRDMKTAIQLYGFLVRHFPDKDVHLYPAREPGWGNELASGSDLILIGGFMSNEIYSEYRSAHEASFERNLRLKMGQLCGVDGQRVYRLGVKRAAHLVPPREPRELEHVPSELVSQDYGLVTSRMAHFYGSTRRVITIAGIRGNGTRAAAAALTTTPDGLPDLNHFLPPDFSRGEPFEMVVGVKVHNDNITSFTGAEIYRNDRRIYPEGGLAGERCGLDRPCAGCKYGLPEDPDDVPFELYPHVPQMAGVRAIIFDLDDTLTDTYGRLIDPLEARAAELMVEAGLPDVSAKDVYDDLIGFRQAHPDDIEGKLRERLTGPVEEALAARRAVFDNAAADLALLKMDTEVERLLARLARTYKLYLVTAGPLDFQREKIEHLDRQYHIKRYFAADPVECIVDSASAQTKEGMIRSLVEGKFEPRAVVVVGNRWDHEVSAGKRLGMRTICVRHGEGSSLVPAGEPSDRDHLIVDDIRELANLL